MATDRLNVIGLVSGGKDSFFSLLHCIEHGHKVVALANLFPATGDGSLPIETQCIDPEKWVEEDGGSSSAREEDETDLNSFMYQTVGHEVIPLYASATGLPLYRRQIHGGAVRHERDYDYTAVASESTEDGEETESMIPLLRSIMERHPEANAVCAGAILSTYQRTRVESIALRLGLIPLAYLWKYPVLPSPVVPADDTQLLKDMEAVGLDARIIKVASAGLDEDHLWLRASSHAGAQKVKRALRKFGAAQGAALGEGGEFETLVVDGPGALFRRRISVPESGRKLMREGGGTSWVKLKGAKLENKEPDETALANVRCPDLLDSRFQQILKNLTLSSQWESTRTTTKSSDIPSPPLSAPFKEQEHIITRTILPEAATNATIQHQTSSIVAQTLRYLESQGLDASRVSNTVIVLRDMANFPVVNVEYGKLFPRANPPSRVTISCGDLLPTGVDIILSLSISPVASGRQGLHVQSRSYWAPANIGPYSQGITTPVAVDGEQKAVRCTSIAGQIPLIPATMLLPEPSETSLQLQITLSLQHLWRIATDMKIQFWTSAVAYFARTPDEADMQRRAKLSAYAWKEANRPPADKEDDENQLDPWDLKHNSEYMTLGDADGQGSTSLPDWDLLPLRQQNDWEPCVPPFFAVEAESLPRQAEVEWHAHVGIGGANSGAIEMFSVGNLAVGDCDAWHMVVRESGTMYLHTTLSYNGSAQRGVERAEDVLQHLNAAYRESLQALKFGHETSGSQSAYLIYLDAGRCDVAEVLSTDAAAGVTLIPCHSLWAPDGTRRSAVMLHRRVLDSSLT